MEDEKKSGMARPTTNLEMVGGGQRKTQKIAHEPLTKTKAMSFGSSGSHFFSRLDPLVVALWGSFDEGASAMVPKWWCYTIMNFSEH